MKIKSYRASALNSYNDCEFRYWLEQNCKFESVSGFAALKGTMVHWVLEILACAKILGRHSRPSKFNNPKYLLDVCWNHYKKKFPQYSWNNIDYAFCRKQINYVLDGPYSPLECDVVATEIQFEIQLSLPGFQNQEGENIYSRGTIDRIDDDGNNIYHIIDYKTGKSKDWVTGLPKDEATLKKDYQFQNYFLAAKHIYPDKDFIFTVMYTSDGGPITFHYDNFEYEQILESIRRQFQKIKINTNPIRLKDDPSRKSELFKCKKVCHFGKTLDQYGISLCDRYHKILKNNDINKAEEILYDISISCKKDKSARNDYERSGIIKGNIN